MLRDVREEARVPFPLPDHCNRIPERADWGNDCIRNRLGINMCEGSRILAMKRKANSGHTTVGKSEFHNLLTVETKNLGSVAS